MAARRRSPGRCTPTSRGLTRYLAVTLRQRISRRMAEAVKLGMALEGLTAADLAYQQG